MTGLTNPLHLVILFLIVLLVFGAKRLPEIGRSLGAGMREFKDSVSGNHEGPGQQQHYQQQQLPPHYQQPYGQPPQQQYEPPQPQPYQPQPTAEPPIGTQDTSAPAPPRENQPTR